MAATAQSAIAVIGIDIGKNSFHVVGQDQRGAIVLRQKWSRGQVGSRRRGAARAAFFAGRLPGILATRTDVLSPRMLRIIEDLAGDWRRLDERTRSSPAMHSPEGRGFQGTPPRSDSWRGFFGTGA